MIDPLFGALLIAAPFLFSFSDRGAPTAICIALGVSVLVLALSTRWPIALVKVVPLPVHLLLDLLTAAFLIVSPFLFSFSDISAPTAFCIIAGVGELLLVLATRWSATPTSGDAPTQRRGRRRRGSEDMAGSQPTT